MAAAVQTRVLIGLADVLAVRLQCCKCESETIIPLRVDRTMGMPDLPSTCPQCHVDIRGEMMRSGPTPELASTEQLFVNLLWLLLQSQEGQPGRVRLEVEPGI